MASLIIGGVGGAMNSKVDNHHSHQLSVLAQVEVEDIDTHMEEDIVLGILGEHTVHNEDLDPSEELVLDDPFDQVLENFLEDLGNLQVALGKVVGNFLVVLGNWEAKDNPGADKNQDFAFEVFAMAVN